MPTQGAHRESTGRRWGLTASERGRPKPLGRPTPFWAQSGPTFSCSSLVHPLRRSRMVPPRKLRRRSPTPASAVMDHVADASTPETVATKSLKSSLHQPGRDGIHLTRTAAEAAQQHQGKSWPATDCSVPSLTEGGRRQNERGGQGRESTMISG